MHAGASPKLGFLILFVHPLHAPLRQNIPRMDQPVQHLGGSFYNLLLFFRQCVGRNFHVQNKIQREVKQWHGCLQTRQVEVVLDKVLVNFAKERVPPQTHEPTDPRLILLPFVRRCPFALLQVLCIVVALEVVLLVKQIIVREFWLPPPWLVRVIRHARWSQGSFVVFLSFFSKFFAQPHGGTVMNDGDTFLVRVEELCY